MASVITTEGRDWLKQKVTDENDEEVYIVAVGDDSSGPFASDTSLGNELYRANDDDSVAVVASTSNTGEVEFRITVSGGNEVPAGSSIVEIGLFTSTSDQLLYREVRDTSVTIESGDRTTFAGTVTFIES